MSTIGHIKPLAGLLILVLVSASGEAQQWDHGHCFYGLSDVRDAPRFQDYPAGRRFTGAPARPLLATPEARRYRTVLRQGAADGPNFAGSFTVVRWGCGSACAAWAVIDARTGRIYVTPRHRTIVNLHGREDRLVHRLDSRLLAVVGAPEEDDAREGIYFLEWTGRAFRQLRFAPVRELCRV